MKPISESDYNKLQESSHQCSVCGNRMLLGPSPRYSPPVKYNYALSDIIFRCCWCKREKIIYDGTAYMESLHKFDSLKALLFALFLTPALIILASIIL